MLRLKAVLLSAAFHMIIASMYLIWIAITLAAATGASNALPIAGKGYSASATYELTTDILIYVGAFLGLVSGVIIIWGLMRNLSRNS